MEEEPLTDCQGHGQRPPYFLSAGGSGSSNLTLTPLTDFLCLHSRKHWLAARDENEIIGFHKSIRPPLLTGESEADERVSYSLIADFENIQGKRLGIVIIRIQ